MTDETAPAVEVTTTVRIGEVTETFRSVAHRPTDPAETARRLATSTAETASTWTWTVKGTTDES